MKLKQLLFILTILSSSITIAQNNDFNNGAADGGLWSSATNWSLGITPISAHTVRTANSATSFVDANFTIFRLQNLFSTTGNRFVNSTTGGILTITQTSNDGIAIQNVSSSGVRLGLRGNITINNSAGGFSDISMSNSALNSIEFESTSLLTLTTALEVAGGSSNNYFFNGKIAGSGNLRIAASASATFGNSVSNAGYTGELVLLANSSLLVNTTDDVVFYDGLKIQVNGNSSTTLNGANVFNSGITVASTHTFTFNVNKNQSSMTNIIFQGGGNLNMAVDNAVTNVTFADNSSNAWLTGTLNITGFKDGVIRFGANSNGLTSTQLSQITVDDGSNGLALDSNGFLYSYDTSWTGAVDTDWSNAGNWSHGVPTAGQDVLIADVTNAPIIGASTNVTLGDLIIQEADGLTIVSGGSLIVNGTSTGNVTYNRNLPTTNWYLVSSPVSGQAYNDAYITANSIASGGGSNRGIASYTTASNTWSYLQSAGSGMFNNGQGYSVKRTASGDISFTGTINTADVSVAVSNASNGFNLVGNPFTSHINSATFLTDNASNLVSETIWVWNQATENYETKVTVDAFVLAPAQGFFVRSSNGTNINIAESYQASTGGTFQKSAKTEVKLVMNDGTADRFAKMYYLDNATKGFDNGFDGETFGGIENSVDIFTNLLENNEGNKYQVQSLPIADMETMIVPVGIMAAAGKEITFTAEAMNLPSDLKVFLEDRVANTMTRLDEANTSYKVTLNEDANGAGRFYVHTKASGVLSTADIALENISVFATNNGTLRIVGLPSGKSNLKLYNILGKQVMQTSFTSTGAQEISLPKLSTGVYLVQLESEAGKLNKKIVLE